MRWLFLGLVLLTGCTTIDYSRAPAPDWPELRVVEHYGTYSGELRKHCPDTSWLVQILACMQPDFENGICNLWFPDWERKDVADWVYNHELDHCKGYDHPGDNELHDLWETYKAKK